MNTYHARANVCGHFADLKTIPPGFTEGMTFTADGAATVSKQSAPSHVISIADLMSDEDELDFETDAVQPPPPTEPAIVTITQTHHMNFSAFIASLIFAGLFGKSAPLA